MKNLRVAIWIAVLLSLLSLLELSSISHGYFVRQAAYLGVALAAFVITSRIPVRFWKFWAPVLYIVSLLFLVGVLFLGGTGAKRWLTLGPVHLQPSELAKFSWILLIPRIYERYGETPQILTAGIVTAVPMLLVLIEPDLATSVTFFVMFVMVSAVLGRNRVLLLYLTLVPLAIIFSFSPVLFLLFIGLSVGIVLWMRLRAGVALTLVFTLITVGLLSPVVVNKGLKPYQRQRIVAFLNPEKYRTGPGWQTLQARIALGSGGILGKGYKKGTQKGLAFLPEAHTDFIFSSFGEEFGLVGTLVVIGGFLILLFHLFGFAESLEFRYHRGVAVGVAAYFLYQSVTNLATNVGLFPVAGIPLPFMTYGGSHLLAEYLMLGILVAIQRREAESHLHTTW